MSKLQNISLKKYSLFVVLFFLCNKLDALVLETKLEASMFSVQHDGSYRNIPDFGGKIEIEEEVLSHFNVKLAFERDSENGNIIWSSITYQSSFINLSVGPSLFILNAPLSFSQTLSAFHPGLNLGMSIKGTSGFIAGIAGNFTFTLANNSAFPSLLQTGKAYIGYRFPHMLSELRYTHRGRVNVFNGDKSFSSITDLGLYTETFSKASRIRIPINVIFRNVKYTSQTNSKENKNYGCILVETGLNVRSNSDIEFGLLTGFSAYSFALQALTQPVPKILFRSQAHIKVALY